MLGRSQLSDVGDAGEETNSNPRQVRAMQGKKLLSGTLNSAYVQEQLAKIHAEEEAKKAKASAR